jgi:hypothetical protein
VSGRYFHVPLDVAQTPANGEAIANRWWAVHPEKGVAFYRIGGVLAAPQCNPDRACAEAVVRRTLPDHVVTHLPVVFKAHAERMRLS